MGPARWGGRGARRPWRGGAGRGPQERGPGSPRGGGASPRVKGSARRGRAGEAGRPGRGARGLRAASRPHVAGLFVCHMKTLRHGEADVTPEVSDSGPAGVRTWAAGLRALAPSGAPCSDPGVCMTAPVTHVYGPSSVTRGCASPSSVSQVRGGGGGGRGYICRTES